MDFTMFNWTKGYLYTAYNSTIRQTFLNVNILKEGFPYSA